MSRRPWVPAAVLSVAACVATAGLVPVGSAGAATLDRLALNGRAPRTVEMNVTVATGGLSASGVIWLNAATDSFSAKLEVPLVSTSTEFDLRAVGHVIYLTSPNLSTASGPVWYTLRASWPRLGAYGHFLAKPDAAILTLLANARVSHQGHFTTYEATRSHVSLGTVGAAHRASPAGKLDVRLTTGAQGEFTSLRASLTSGAATTTVSMNVVSYNHPVTIVAPPRSRATTSAAPLLRQLFTSGVLGSFVLPGRWLQALSRAKLS
ncbi:MAG: hypothetical protein HIU57_07815 [Acidobacteria bacterium]|nr:hypothetical protein [Acidobacteriota bacterium]